jgi:MFS family permease
VCSTAFEPALPTMMRDFHSDSDSLSSLFITVYLLGYVLGPLLIAPASELYGRTFVLRPAYVLFMITLIVCGSAKTLTVFIVIRCFMGFAANAFVIVGPAIVADMIPPDQRGLALSVLSSGPILVRLIE